MKKIFLIILSVLSLPALALSARERSGNTIYEMISPAIVSIDSQLSSGVSCGTGCIIDKNGTILTSAHVLDEGKDVIVTTSNGEDYKAKIIKKFGEKKDVALIKISVPHDLQTVKLGNSEKIKVGEKVYAIGNPFGFTGTFTQGIVSRIDYVKNRIQTDAAINPGSSGGPLLNASGEIIGINQAIYNPDNNISNIGIGFAIPINSIREYLLDKEDLKEENSIQR